LLLQAAQTLNNDSFVPARRDALPATVQALVAQAEACLQEAMTRWRDLRDPEVSESNFMPPGTSDGYNYRAADTYRVQLDLGGGLLTRYPLSSLASPSPEANQQPHPIASAPTTPAERPAAIASPRVLISYSHDSPAHAARVLQLSNRLRTDGVDCTIDQYVPNPSEGWPLWMNSQVEAADFVLIIFTERYTTRSMTPQQSGVRFESVLLLQDLYEAGMINKKFIPVLLEPGDDKHIMKWFRLFNHYAIHTDAGYDLLLRRLLDDPAVVPPPLGTPTRRGPVN
ncbi:MAG TPA: toll/interleukin-1 receptor domain-containing protein, partial [Nodosilinea sp.]|nr:toll/interleukin-1 receptor domain-containing protein [Nodosilinea sp.]